MWETLRKIGDLLEPGACRRLLLVLAMILVAGTVETAALTSIMPFMAVLGNPDAVEATWYLSPAYNWLGFETTDNFLVFLGGVVLFCAVSSAVFRVLANWAMLNFTSRQTYSLSRRLFQEYLYRSYSWFLGRHTADLGKTILYEVDQVIGGALIPGMQLINQGTILLFLTTVLILVDASLALPFIAVLGGAYWLIFWASRRYLHRMGELRVQANTKRFRLSSEALSGIKEVKVLGVEDAFLSRFEEPSRLFVQAVVVRELIAEVPQHALRTIALVGVMLILQYQLLLHGDVGQALPLITLFVVAGSRLMPALQKVYHCGSKLRFVKPALDLLHSDLVEGGIPRPSLVKPSSNGANRLCLGDRLELRHVSYCYPDASTSALEDVNLTIPARASVGLVGQTGAGKTTLVDIILGLLEMDEGQVLVNGVPITGANKRSWQRCVGYVPQHIFLADDSVAANIAFGTPPAEIDKAAVERSARIANLHDFVTAELKCGYDTLIGERGVRLSGGERQRVGIARALYRDPDLLIMDEATNALDNITERAVMDAVANLARQKTIIVIAHRLATVRRCDIIFLLERGRVVASGGYDALIDDSVRFREMVSAS